jgi:hypothetical protein
MTERIEAGHAATFKAHPRRMFYLYSFSITGLCDGWLGEGKAERCNA